MSRREFLERSAGAAVALSMAAEPSGGSAGKPAARPKKGILWPMLPADMSVQDRFQLARDVGFEGVEMPPLPVAEAEKHRAAAERAGIRIPSVIYGGWDPPLSTGDPEGAKRAVQAASDGLRAAKAMGADAMLLVPGVVNATTRYVECYERSQKNVRSLIPLAQELKVEILIEEVWNNFLLSPLEFARYVDEFKSPWVQAYFDVGNVVRFAWPEDWVRTLGKRIRKVHLKDFKGGPGLWGPGEFVNLREGSINWPEVMRAFAEVGYADYMTLELGGGDRAYLQDLSQRVDKILAGE